jgi:tripartite-type tricarboxylate transporter receptor subunit TctC
MPRSSRFLAPVVVAVAALLPSLSAAQEPQRGPIRLIVGFPAGGNVDLPARIAAEALTARLGRGVEVENHLGRAGDAAAAAVAQAVPDGTTIGFVPVAVTIARHFSRDAGYDSRDAGYDPRTGFTPISKFAAVPIVILVSPDLAARDIRGLGDALRAQQAACAASGNFLHLATALLVRDLGADCRIARYNDNASAIADLQAGRAQVYVNLAPTTMPALREGRVRAIAVASPQRIALAPEVPTVAETVPGFEFEAWMALVGPRGMPEVVTTRLERAAMEATRDPSVSARLRELGAEPVGSTAAELAATIAAEDARWAAAARAAGLGGR